VAQAVAVVTVVAQGYPYMANLLATSLQTILTTQLARQVAQALAYQEVLALILSKWLLIIQHH